MDRDGTTEMMWACIRGDNDLIQHILNNEDVYLNHENESGDTALLFAIEFLNDINIVKMLVNYEFEKINLNHKNNDKKTVLHYACMYNKSIDILKLFLSFEHIDLNAKDCYGWTPLMYASSWGDSKKVKLLLEKNGLDIYSKNNQSTTAFEVVNNFIAPKEGQNATRLLFQERKKEEFLILEYIRNLKIPSICKDISTEVASYLSWNDVSPNKKAPENIFQEYPLLKEKYQNTQRST